MAADKVKADGTGVPNHRPPPGPCHVTPITRFFTASDYRGNDSAVYAEVVRAMRLA